MITFDYILIGGKNKRYTLLPLLKKTNAKKFSPCGRNAFAHLLRYPGLAVLGVQLHPGVPCK